MQHRILIGINTQVGKTMLIFRPALKNECRSEENYSWSAKQAITSNGEHCCLTWSFFLCHKGDRWIQVWLFSIYIMAVSSLHANPNARSPGQVKLDSDKWKLWQNLFEWIEVFFLILAFGQVGEKNESFLLIGETTDFS